MVQQRGGVRERDAGDGWRPRMLIDLHAHTKFSGDNYLEPAAFVQLAKARGLDAVCVTEHNSVEASEPVVHLGRDVGLHVLQGVEVTADVGHILCFGFEDDSWARFRRNYYTPIRKLRECAEEVGAVLVPAHPFRRWVRNAVGDALYDMPYITAVEVGNGLNSRADNLEAHQAAQTLGLRGTGGSDSHTEAEVAQMATRFREPIDTIQDLVRALREGEYDPVMRNADGTFSPYIDGEASTET